MKFSTSFVILLLSCLSSKVIAENVIRYLFNNGVPNSALICNATDWAKIDPFFDNVKSTRRSLRQVNTISQARTLDFEMDIIGQHNVKERDLQTHTAAYCKRECEGIASRQYCKASGCTWYVVRRNLGDNMSERDLQSTWCTNTANSINSQINNLVATKQLSGPCINLMNAPRKIECLDDIIYGVVEHFNIWNADTDVMIKKDARNGYSVCGANVRLNIEARTNPCVVAVKTELRGPNGYYATNDEAKVPYTIFGNSGAKVYNMYGNILQPGSYTIKAVPDGDTTKTKEMTFTVANC